MKYYKLNFSLSKKIRGNNEYVKKYCLKIPNDKMYWEEPIFIGNIRNEKIDFHPYLLDIELFQNSIVNDLIMDGGPISTKLIISGRLKSILEDYRKNGMQFFNINILKKNVVFSDYWILNMYVFNQELIDFSKCKIIYRKKDDDFEVTFSAKNVVIEVNNIKEFNDYIENAKEKLETITIEELSLTNNISEDFFILKYVFGGVGYYVSEKLKQEIEDSGCTGIEFMPAELSWTEWIQGGEREKIYGKSY
ncbi:imm11 family protein [Flavobacterium sp.]|uniref:imm11 family protein n=1 Tax=Flavobacterium sp. TaxID=239 RepID=UPI003F695374